MQAKHVFCTVSFFVFGSDAPLPACGAAAFVVEDDDVDGGSDQVVKLALLEESWHSHMIFSADKF